MLITAKVWKDGRFWLAEIPALDLMTQGLTRREVLEMAESIVVECVDHEGFHAKVIASTPGEILIQTSDSQATIAAVLRRQREKSGLTLREVAARMGSSSPNAFAAYEQGKRSPTLDQLEKLLKAVGERDLLLNVG